MRRAGSRCAPPPPPLVHVLSERRINSAPHLLHTRSCCLTTPVPILLPPPLLCVMPVRMYRCVSALSWTGLRSHRMFWPQRGLCVEPRNADLKKNLKEIDELIRGEKVTKWVGCGAGCCAWFCLLSHVFRACYFAKRVLAKISVGTYLHVPLGFVCMQAGSTALLVLLGAGCQRYLRFSCDPGCVFERKSCVFFCHCSLAVCVHRPKN